jgi:hypothetical protein
MAIPRINEFMMTLGKRLSEERKVTESSVNSYLKTLFMLNDKKPFKSLTFLKNKEAIGKKLEGYAESTQRSMLGAISSVLSLFKEKGPYKKIYEHYAEVLKARKTGGEEADMGTKTAKESDAWLSWEDVEKRRKEIYDVILGYKNPKSVSPEQYSNYLNYAVLSLYTLLPPRRNQDYLNMTVVSKWHSELPTDTNYLDLDGKGMPTRFVFNKYKTVKKHGQQIVDIPKELGDALLTYLKHSPARPTGRSKTFQYPFLVNANGAAITAVNGITRILNKIFGKKIGSSMLRHIFLSNKYDISEMQKDADLMAHTVATQRKYLRAEDAPTLVVGEPDSD